MQPLLCNIRERLFIEQYFRIFYMVQIDYILLLLVSIVTEYYYFRVTTLGVEYEMF